MTDRIALCPIGTIRSPFRSTQGMPIQTVAAAEVAVGLAIIVALFRARQSVNLEHLDTLRG